MHTIHTKRLVHGIVAIFSFLFMLGIVGLVYSLDEFDSPFLFVSALLVEICLIVIFVYSAIRALAAPLRILGSILYSAWMGALSNNHVQNLRATKSQMLRWLGDRINHQRPDGLLLTVGLLIACINFFEFTNVLLGVTSNPHIMAIDVRVAHLMPEVRTQAQTRFFQVITTLASPVVIVLLVIVSALLLWLRRKRLASIAVIIVAVTEGVLTFVIKVLVGRSRPDRTLSLITLKGHSFPSGHVMAATVIFGLLAYLIFRSYKSSLVRLGVVLSYIVLVGLVGVSRIYLAAHYPFDVLGAIYLGAGLLTVAITTLEVMTRTERWHIGHDTFSSRSVIFIIPAFIIFSFITGTTITPLSTVVATSHDELLPSLSNQAISRLPSSSQTLTGQKAEPISFIYLGSKSEITNLFLTHGWYKADRSTLANTLQAVAVGFQGRQYLTAPVTPMYVAEQPESLAFEQPTLRDTLRQRHHTRLWRTSYILHTGQEIWVATASFDEGVELNKSLLPTHRIAPDLDAERGYIIQSLQVTPMSFVQVIHAQAGQNSSGDIYFTDGRAAVITL